MLFPAPARALSEAYRDAWSLADAESLRWRGVHRQQTSRTCGPATLVTLLTYHYGIPVTEEEAARRALGLPPEEATPQRLAAPASMRGLRDALRSWGLEVYGVRMSVEGLAAYLREQGRPVVVRIVHPEPHFTLLTGIVKDHTGEHHVLMADSALGWRALPLEEFAGLWDGYGLVVVTPLPSAPAVHEAAGLGYKASEPAEFRGRLDHLQRGLLW